MQNRIPKAVIDLVTMGDEIANGAKEYGDSIPLLQNTHPNIRGDITPVVDAMKVAGAATTELRTRQQEVRTLLASARRFMTLTRDILKPHLGNHHNENWFVLGLVDSLFIPRYEREVVGTLRSFALFLAMNPSFEVAVKDVTAAAGECVAEPVRCGAHGRRSAGEASR